jgi:hypothetical protein
MGRQLSFLSKWREIAELLFTFFKLLNKLYFFTLCRLPPIYTVRVQVVSNDQDDTRLLHGVEYVDLSKKTSECLHIHLILDHLGPGRMKRD